MRIRAWERTDIDRIAEMERQCFKDPWSKDMLEDTFKYPYYHCFLAEEGGQVCGYCCLIAIFEDAEVGNIAVDLAFRGRGIGAKLMEAMHEKAKSLGAKRCLLEVRVSNASAIALYEKYGYKRYGIRAKYYEDGEDAFVMEKSL